MFTPNERAEILALCHEEMRILHRANQRRGSYRYLCMVDDGPLYCHTPRGETVIDFNDEPNL